MNMPTTLVEPAHDAVAELACTRIFAIAAVTSAREHLARYALGTDCPPLGMVDAADLLDAAHAVLTEGARHDDA